MFFDFTIRGIDSPRLALYYVSKLRGYLKFSDFFLVLTLFDRKAYSKKVPVHNLVTHYRDIEDLDEILDLLDSLRSYVPF